MSKKKHSLKNHEFGISKKFFFADSKNRKLMPLNPSLWSKTGSFCFLCKFGLQNQTNFLENDIYLFSLPKYVQIANFNIIKNFNINTLQFRHLATILFLCKLEVQMIQHAVAKF